MYPSLSKVVQEELIRERQVVGYYRDHLSDLSVYQSIQVGICMYKIHLYSLEIMLITLLLYSEIRTQFSLKRCM